MSNCLLDYINDYFINEKLDWYRLQYEEVFQSHENSAWQQQKSSKNLSEQDNKNNCTFNISHTYDEIIFNHAIINTKHAKT